MFASSKTNNLRLTLSGEGLELYASDPDKGEAQRHVDVQADVDDDIKVGINHRYLSDVLSAVDDPEVAVTILDTKSPMTVRPSERDDTLFVIMPMRL
jgi:DNA polymerase-3 subunit beta